MEKKKQLLLRLFILLFSVSVSATVLPSGIVNVYGLFGEITSSAATEDRESPSSELLEDAEEKQTLESLLDLIDEGRINEAENSLYESIENLDKSGLEMALLFYLYLNDKSDEFLEEHDFSRDEVKQGLKDVTARYGVNGFAEMFLT